MPTKIIFCSGDLREIHLKTGDTTKKAENDLRLRDEFNRDIVIMDVGDQTLLRTIYHNPELPKLRRDSIRDATVTGNEVGLPQVESITHSSRPEIMLGM